MKKNNPVYIPRNHIIEKVIFNSLHNDFKPFFRLMDVIMNPYKEKINKDYYSSSPRPEEVVRETYCGT